MQTITYKEIFNELDILNKDISKIINNKSSNLDDYIKDISYIHYRLTIIHPFIDRNGRTARAFLNWLLVKKNFCPIYIDSKNRNEYLKALQEIDINNNYEPLEMIIIKCIINSVIDLRINKKDI